MSEWAVVQSYKELPVGDWLVVLDNSESADKSNFKYEIAHVFEVQNGTAQVIGGLFGYDQLRVLAYRRFPRIQREDLHE